MPLRAINKFKKEIFFVRFTELLKNVFKTYYEKLTCPDLREFSSIFMRLAEFSSGVPAVGGRGPAPTEAGRPIEAEDGDRELVGVRLL